MRTVRRGNHLPRGVSTQVDAGICLPRRGVCPSAFWDTHPSCKQNDWQTGVKALPFRNYVTLLKQSRILPTLMDSKI